MAKVMIVDDEEGISSYLAEKLQEKGHNISMVLKSGEDAVRYARLSPPDIIIMDILLEGELDGIEAAKKIHEDFDVPILFLSGNANEKRIERAIQTGPFGILLKPFRGYELSAAVEMALYRAQAEKKIKEREERTAELVEANRRLRDEIEKRKRKEEELRLLSYAMEQSSEGIAVVDLKANVLFINHAFAESHGYAAEELVGRHFSIFHNKEQLQQMEDANRQILKKGDFLGEIWHARRDGTIFPAMMHASLLHDEDGRPIAMVWTLRDITELKKMERQLFQSEKLASLGFLASGIAHEINNPNSFITFNIPILRDYLNELMTIIDEYAAQHRDLEFFGMPYHEFREDVFRLLDDMQHGTDRITSTVSELRNFMKQGSRGETRKVSLKALIGKALSMCRGKISRMVNSFEVIIPDDTPKIRTDPESLKQVLINLLINAAQAADKEDSWVRLGVLHRGAPDNIVIIEVSDNGCGMNKETTKRIFDPFFTTKPVGDGTGLGLSVCHRLMEQLGGHIEVESKPGKGSTFRAILPVQNQRTHE